MPPVLSRPAPGVIAPRVRWGLRRQEDPGTGGPTFLPTHRESVAFYLQLRQRDLKSTFVTVSGDRNSFTESPGTGSCGFATVGPGQRCFVRIDYDPATPGKHRAVVRVSAT